MSVTTVVLLVFSMVFGVGAIAIIAEHFQKMAQIRAQARLRTQDAALKAIDELRLELASLRDTTTRYDVSFDTALQRIEERVGRMEHRLSALEHQPAQTVRE